MLKAEVRQAGLPPATSDGRGHAFARYAWGVLAYNVAVVLWGAYVRASGSGAGCGNHWPLCNGEVTPHSPAVATIVEFTHRAMTGLDTPLVALLAIWAFRAFPRRHPVRRAALLSAVFLVIEALIGAGLVLLERVAKNASAYWQSAHLINTLTLLAFLTLTAWWAGGKPTVLLRGRAAWMAGVSLAVVALLGVSGAIAALGDTLFPAQSLAAGLAQDWDPSANIFLRLRGLHPLIAAGTGAWLLFYAISSASRRPEVRGRAWIVVACLGAQILAGALNLLLLAPIWMQMIHLLLANLLWISLVLLCASMLAAKTEAV
jgi:heme A synthase